MGAGPVTASESGGLPPVDDALLDALVRNVTLAADQVAIGFRGAPAQQTRAVIRAALANGIRNGALTITPQETWPEWWELDA